MSNDHPTGMSLGSERAQRLAEGEAVSDPALGRVAAVVQVDEDGARYSMACPCGWFAAGASIKRGINHARTCRWALPQQASLTDEES